MRPDCGVTEQLLEEAGTMFTMTLSEIVQNDARPHVLKELAGEKRQVGYLQ